MTAPGGSFTYAINDGSDTPVTSHSKPTRDMQNKMFFIYLTVLSFLAFHVQELSCSKYENHEKMLERILRMELEVGQMLEETQEMKLLVKRDLTAIRNERDEIEVRIERYRQTQMQTINTMKETLGNYLDTKIEEYRNITDDVVRGIRLKHYVITGIHYGILT